MSWYEAMAFCIWDGGYLPTEPESNYAASGGTEYRMYPWSIPATSPAINCTYANDQIDIPAGMYCVNGLTGGINRVGKESPEGDGRWGHSDLAGNVREWTLDWFSSAYQMECNDCANLTESADRTARGGAFAHDYARLRAAYRSYYAPTYRTFEVGLRCARTP